MAWSGTALRLLDQTRLPEEIAYIECSDYRRVADAIKRLEVRGAPAIGAAAAFGVVLGALEYKNNSASDYVSKIRHAANELRQTRPTAVNLFWALDRMLSVTSRFDEFTPRDEIIAALDQEARKIFYEDQDVNRRISICGAALFPDKISVLTHCNAGALATVAFGTALGVIRQLWHDGRLERVYADETRPLLQGARLTAWELCQEGIPVTLITDNMAGWLMRLGKVQAVITGADRIARNGDVANKIGTYSVAVLAHHHGIPFYAAAPSSTFDFMIADGSQIPIEERAAREITHIGGKAVAPVGVSVFNPAFDVTPAELVAGIITEYGVLKPPYADAINDMIRRKAGSK